MDKAEFINRVRSGRARWDELIGRLGDNQMLARGVEWVWSASYEAGMASSG